jgi:hypothetical protein
VGVTDLMVGIRNTSRIKMKEARTASAPVAPVETTPMLRFLPLLCNLIFDPRVIL